MLFETPSRGWEQKDSLKHFPQPTFFAITAPWRVRGPRPDRFIRSLGLHRHQRPLGARSVAFQGIASLLRGVTTGSPLPAAGQRGIASMRVKCFSNLTHSKSFWLLFACYRLKQPLLFRLSALERGAARPCSQWPQSPVSPLIFQTPVTVYFIYTRDTHILGTVGTRNKTKHLKWGQNWGQTGDRPGTSFALPPVAPCPTG